MIVININGNYVKLEVSRRYNWKLLLYDVCRVRVRWEVKDILILVANVGAFVRAVAKTYIFMLIISIMNLFLDVLYILIYVFITDTLYHYFQHLYCIDNN